MEGTKVDWLDWVNAGWWALCFVIGGAAIFVIWLNLRELKKKGPSA